MSKGKLTPNISQKQTNSWEKSRPIGPKGTSGRASDPQRNYRLIPRFISQVARLKV